MFEWPRYPLGVKNIAGKLYTVWSDRNMTFLRDAPAIPHINYPFPPVSGPSINFGPYPLSYRCEWPSYAAFLAHTPKNPTNTVTTTWSDGHVTVQSPNPA